VGVKKKEKSFKPPKAPKKSFSGASAAVGVEKGLQTNENDRDLIGSGRGKGKIPPTG